MILEIFNRKLKRSCLDYSCLVGFGTRGAGKSSVMALVADEAIKDGRDVYCQFPYDGVHQIPLKQQIDSRMKRFDVDKEWLYSHKFEPYSVIMLDEGSTIWPARDHKNWTRHDSDFFNFIRKQHITIIIMTQYYDQLDLNVKRSADETWFLNKSVNFKHFTTIEASETLTVKIADTNTEVLGKAFKRGARKVTYDVCEIPKRNYKFYMKPYYGKFLTDYVPFDKTPQPQPLWNEIIQFNNS